MSNIFQINPVLDVGLKDLELYMEVAIDGKAVIEKKADSLVPNFLRALFAFMASDDYPTVTKYCEDTLDETTSLFEIQDASNATPIVINVNGAHGAVTGQYMQIMGVNGNTAANGLWQITVIDPDEFSLDGSVGNGAFVGTGAPKARLFKDMSATGENTRDAETFSLPDMRLGLDNTANTSDQWALNNEIPHGNGAGMVEPGTISVGVPAVGTSTSEITITQSFTNNSGSALDLREMGLYARANSASFDDRYILIARDLITTTLSDGSTITVNYKLRITLGVTGGFVKWFMETLYRQLALTTRTVTRVTGGTQNAGQAEGHFILTAPSGRGRVSTTGSGVQGWEVGVQVGGGNTAVAIDDIALETPFVHGTGTDELLIYGCTVENFTVGVTETTFEVTRFFENQSGAQITVNEIALYSSRTTGSASLETPVMMARHVLAAPVNIPDGDLLKVTYTIKLTV